MGLPFFLFSPSMNLSHLHFSGVAGSGMSALAQYLAMSKRAVTGSDRSLDQGANAKTRDCLERLRIGIPAHEGMPNPPGRQAQSRYDD